jgi:ubiquinone/menaquinone biosynthesis C-methylase UbiE
MGKLSLPNQNLLVKTGPVDYYDWNYKFPLKYIQRLRFLKVLRLLKDEKFNSLLEIGTGSGIFLKELSKFCDDLYAIDIHNRLNLVNSMCKKLQISANLVQANVEQIGFKDNSFDAIVTVSTLEFVENLDKVICEIRRVMKQNGIFIAVCPRINPLAEFFLSFYSQKRPKDEFIVSRKRISKSLKASFKIVKIIEFPAVFNKFFPLYTFFKLTK